MLSMMIESKNKYIKYIKISLNFSEADEAVQLRPVVSGPGLQGRPQEFPGHDAQRGEDRFS
jgi:hypothetical protein